MSLETQQERTHEDIYDVFQEHMEHGEWIDARDLIVHCIENDYNTLASTLQREYNENVCQDCLGTGVVVEGDFDNQTEKQCLCQK